MTLLIIALVCAGAGGILTYWRPPRWPRDNLLLAIAAAPQVASMLGLRLPWLLAGSVVAIGLWYLYNRTLTGVLCITIGAGMNMLVMALHGGAMPVHASTLAALGEIAAPGTILAGSKDVVIQSSPLGLLADWLVIQIGSRAIIASPGDLFALTGIVYWLLASPSQRKDPPHVPGHHWFPLRSRHSCPSGGE
jgi:uncharacterized protein DUF5317